MSWAMTVVSHLWTVELALAASAAQGQAVAVEVREQWTVYGHFLWGITLFADAAPGLGLRLLLRSLSRAAALLRWVWRCRMPSLQVAAMA